MLDIDVVSGDRLDGFAEQLFHLPVGSAGGNGDVRGLHGDNDAAATGNNLKRMTGGGDWGWFSTVIPQLRSNEDEEQDERDHDVVVERPAGIGPVEVAAEDLPEVAFGLRDRAG